MIGNDDDGWDGFIPEDDSEGRDEWLWEQADALYDQMQEEDCNTAEAEEH